MSKLSELATTPASNTKPWTPPDHVVDDIVNARANGYGWESIAKALIADGIPAGRVGVQSWFERRERLNHDSAD